MLLTTKHVGQYHPQKTFDCIVAHRRKHGYKRSQRAVKRPDGSIDYLCAYKGDNGCECAAMAVIPQEAYMPEFEEHTIKFALLRFLTRSHNYDLVYDMQLIHDTCSPDAWPAAWAGIANKYKLQFDQTPDNEYFFQQRKNTLENSSRTH